MVLGLALLLTIISSPLMAVQKIHSLSKNDEHLLQRHRHSVMQYLDAVSLEKYTAASGKLGTIRALLMAKPQSEHQDHELISMGVVLGDAFVQDMGFHWIVVLDDVGRELALRFQDTSVILFPTHMIAKRVWRGEAVDIFDLYNGVASLAEEQISSSK